MAFDRLPPQGSMGAKADAYAAECLARSRAVAETARCVLDVPYGPDPWQALDLYLPDDPAARGAPVLLFLHGGGWTHGHKEWMGFMAPPLTALPCVFVSVGYRLVPAVDFAAQYADVLAAVAWVHGHAAEHGGDPARLFLGGHSAGGHLASLAALQPDRLATAGVPAAAVRGCFPVSTPFVLGQRYAESGPDARIDGAPLLQAPGDAEALSPLSHVAGNRVPFLIAWGGDERRVFADTGERMRAALTTAGAPVEVLVAVGCDHFQVSLAAGDHDDPWVRAVRRRLATAP